MRLLLAGLLLLAASASAQVQSEWERENAERLMQSQEQPPVAPPPLERSQLVELQLDGPSDFRYFVDATSLSVGADRIVRYTLVARSPSGVENLSFEGLRCPGEYRIYAVGRPDGSWSGRASAWREIPRHRGIGQHALSRRYFCLGHTAIRDAQEGIAALRAGGRGPYSQQN